jgi:hypothetical protein
MAHSLVQNGSKIGSTETMKHSMLDVMNTNRVSNRVCEISSIRPWIGFNCLMRKGGGVSGRGYSEYVLYP